MIPFHGLEPLPFKLDNTGYSGAEMLIEIDTEYGGWLELVRNRLGLSPRRALKSSALAGRWDENWCPGHSGVFCGMTTGHAGACGEDW